MERILLKGIENSKFCGGKYFSMQFFLLKGFFFLYALIQVVLSKFVRQMGDLLPSTLYISYLRMLKGLANGPQCAHYCFSLLKTNGATHSKSILFTFFLD